MANILAFLKMANLYLLGPAIPSRIEGNITHRYPHPAETARDHEITDLVERRAGGRICVEFNENNRPLYACIVEVAKENLDLLLEPPVAVVYTGQIPRSTVRRYDPQLKLAARIWNAFREGYASQSQPAAPSVGNE